MGKLSNFELCKKLKFDHMNKWYMYNPESVLENVTQKLLCDFDMQTDHQILARRTDQVIINNKKKRELAELWNFLSRVN